MPDFAVAPSPVLNASQAARGSSASNAASSLGNASATSDSSAQDFSATLRQRLHAQQAKPPEKAPAKQAESRPQPAATAKTAASRDAQQAPDAATTASGSPATEPGATAAVTPPPTALTPADAAFLASLPAATGAGSPLDTAKRQDADDASDDTQTDVAPPAAQDNTAMLQSLAVLASNLPAHPNGAPRPGDGGDTADAATRGKTQGSANSAAGNVANLAAQAANLASSNRAEGEKSAAAGTDVTAISTPAAASSTVATNTAAEATTPATPFQVSLDAARQMQAAHAQAATAPQAGHPVSRSEAPVGSNAWHQEVADRVVWMAGSNTGRADLVLNPPQLGRIEISLNVTGDQATASFVAANPNVREALENALPRLREALNDAGIQLGQTNVGAGTPQFASQQGETGHNPASGRIRNDADSALARVAESALPATPTRWQQQGTSLVDAFA